MLSRSRIVLRSVLSSTVQKGSRSGLQLPPRIAQLELVPVITARGYANRPGGGPRGPFPPGGTHRMNLCGGEYH